ncbi:MAG: HlyC/CorC family transporter [Deltaproteobacteria bacterium]|nr:HlyC/CorC family transporter [Deltaproteobacteria bacterium]
MSDLILILCCVICSAFFSGAETAIISASRIKIRHLASLGNRSAIAVEKSLARPERVLTAALVGNNVFVVLGSILAATYALSLLDQRENLAMVAATVVMTPVMLIFGENLPKTLFYRHANWLVLRVVPVVELFSVILYPLIQICSLPARGISLLLGDEDKRKSPFVTREELKLLIMEGQSDLNVEEQEMIGHLFRFSETLVGSIMVPLERVVMVDVKGTVRDAASRIRESGFSRLPVFEDRTDNIVGYVAVQDILGLDAETPLLRVRRPVVFLPETEKISQALLHLKQMGQHMAMAVTRNGRVSGLVTLEDIVEEIVGEIEDEYDVSPPVA